MAFNNPLNVGVVCNRMGMEKKVGRRFLINTEILEPTSNAPTTDSLLLNLPAEVILEFYKAIPNITDQISMALTCKVMGRIATFADLNVSHIDDAEDTDDPDDDYADGRYNRDRFRNYETNPIPEEDDMRGLVRGSTFRLTKGLRDGLFVDVPNLLVSLRDLMPEDLRLCHHCMTYRPVQEKYWAEKIKTVKKWKPRPSWGKRGFMVDHEIVLKPGTGGLRWSWKPKIYRVMDRCPFCRCFECAMSSKSCIGCRMQAEVRKMQRGSY